MSHACSKKLISGLIFGMSSSVAMAAGFQLFEQNASGIGNAFAGSAAVAENASTIYHNPAGMTQLRTFEISTGIAAAKSSIKFSNNDSAESVGNAGRWLTTPNAYLSWGITKDLYAGIGISRPFGYKINYGGHWAGDERAMKFDLRTVNINPSLAYRVNERVSLGFGLNWQKFDAEHSRLARDEWGGEIGTGRLKLNDSAIGWNAGALFTVSPSTRVGVAYRSRIRLKTTGDGAWVDNGGIEQGRLSTNLTMPDTFAWSVAQRISGRWDMLGGVTWTGWKSCGKVSFIGADNNPVRTLDPDFRNTWRVALGANYRFSDAWRFRYGIAYEQSPVRGARGSPVVSMPDNNRYWFSFGTQWLHGKSSRLDLGLAYIYMNNFGVNVNHLSGNYSSSFWIFGGQYSVAF